MTASIESWGELVAALYAAREFVEAAYTETDIHNAEERAGAAHCARLLGHVADAFLLAAWIQSVGEAAARAQEE
jgi:hypothetical protein